MNIQRAFEQFRDDIKEWVCNNITLRVPITRTVNGKPLSDDITLSFADVGADKAGSAEQAANTLKEYVNTRSTYGVCTTGSAISDKAVSCNNFELVQGAEITVKFTYANTALNPTLNVNGSGAIPIFYAGNAIPIEITGIDCIQANYTYQFNYNGTQWDLVGVLTSIPEDYKTTIKDLTVLHDQMTYTRLDGSTGNVTGYSEHIGKKLDGDGIVTGISRVNGEYVINTSDAGSIPAALQSDVTNLSSELKGIINSTKNELETDITNLSSSTNQQITSTKNELSNKIADVNTTLDTKINNVNTNLTNKINSDIATVNSTITTQINSVTQKITTLENKKASVHTVTLSTSGWSGSGPYTQSVTVSGMTTTWVPNTPTIVSSGNQTTDLNMIEAMSCLNVITSNNGSLTFKCYEEKPAVNITLNISGMVK